MVGRSTKLISTVQIDRNISVTLARLFNFIPLHIVPTHSLIFNFSGIGAVQFCSLLTKMTSRKQAFRGRTKGRGCLLFDLKRNSQKCSLTLKITFFHLCLDRSGDW